MWLTLLRRHFANPCSPKKVVAPQYCACSLLWGSCSNRQIPTALVFSTQQLCSDLRGVCLQLWGRSVTILAGVLRMVVEVGAVFGFGIFIFSIEMCSGLLELLYRNTMGWAVQRDIHLHLVPEDGGKVLPSQGHSPCVTNCHLPKIFYVA